MNQKQADNALARNLKRRANEPKFNPAQYKRVWYAVGRRLSQNRRKPK